MKEVARVGLENEMDLIIAHKRVMKLCELTGFSLITQTLIATAVSEISRCAIEYGTNAVLKVGIEAVEGKKFVKAVISDPEDFSPKCKEAYAYAKRLVSFVNIVKTGNGVEVSIKQQVSFGGTLTDNKIESFIDYFKNEPPLSAYDELRKKNSLLKDLAEKLKESESEYRVLTDSLPLMMFSVNNYGIINYTNQWLQQFLGIIPKELNNQAWVNCLHPDDYPNFAKEVSNAMQKQTALTGQYRFKEKATGLYIWHMFSIKPLKNDNGAVSRWIGFIVDINAKKQMEQQTLKFQ